MGLYLLKLSIALPVLFFTGWLLMQWVQKTQAFPFKQSKLLIVDQLKVSPKATLQVVQVGQQFLLMSVTEQQVSLVKELTDAEAVCWMPASSEHHATPQNQMPPISVSLFLTGMKQRVERMKVK